ncbi:MAG: LOG family protein [Anaerolineales bacterium]
MDNNPPQNKSLRVTVFGGSSPKPGSPAYFAAYTLGKWLGNKGYIVLNGGYIGTMEAVSKGARESDGKVIGITCDQIETWRPIAPNPYLSEEIRFPTLQQRLYALIDLCDLAVALAGGIGTLAEISTMWTQMDIQAIPLKPLILVGQEWQRVMANFAESMQDYVNPRQLREITFANDINDAVEKIELFSQKMYDSH